MKTARAFFGSTPLVLRIAALYFIIVAVIISSFTFAPKTPAPVYAEANPPALQEQAKEVVVASPTVKSMPMHLTVARLGVDLEVKPGTYDAATKTWTLDNTSAFYATVSQLPGTEPGTTFIYAHNRKSAFGPLANVQVGDLVTLQLEDGHVLTYEYARDVKVSPESTNIMYEKSDIPQLVLMTCEGLLSSARRVMYFSLKDVQ